AGILLSFAERVTPPARAPCPEDVEEALRESEERLAFVTERAHAGYWQWDIEEDAVEWSPLCRELYGVPSGEPLSYERFVAAVHPADRAEVRQATRKALEQEGDFDLVFRTFRPDGSVRWIHELGSAQRTPVRRMAGIALDITASKEAEEALRASEERLNAAIEGGDLGVWEWDLRSNHVLWNRWVYTLLGHPEEAGPGTAGMFLERVHPEDRARLEGHLNAMSQPGDELDCEYRIHRMDTGEERWLASRGRLICDEDGRPARMIGVNFDITSRKRLEGRLRAAAEEMSEANRRKDRFIATLAHELRNPLTPIRTGLDILRTSGDDATLREELRATIERQTLQLVALVDDLMDISRITRGSFQLKTRRVALAEVLRSAVEMTCSCFEAAGQDFIQSGPDAPIELEGDPHRLTQIVGNLLNNASTYTPHGGRIELAVRQSGGEVLLEVRDNGIGIAPEMQERVFEFFSQANCLPDRLQAGLGIGLSLVRSLVERHGGSIALQSDGEGKGSCFTVRLPILGDRAPETPAPSAPNRSPPRRRILLADDNPSILRALSLYLRKLGNEVHTACDGAEACRLAEQCAPDLILMDIGMPTVDGHEAARRIRRNPGGARPTLVALSGWGREEDKAASREAGFDHHLTKPVPPEKLKRLLEEIGRTASAPSPSTP
ncbi:MAG: PAS domain-containing protein, partial [Opitutales bacterium]